MISICCPSRGRPTMAKRMIDTAYKTVSDTKNIEFLMYLNDDDPALPEYKKYIDLKHYTIGPNQSTCYSWNQLATQAKHDIVFLAGDDIQFMTKDWDLSIKKGFDQYDDKICMVVPFDGNGKGKGKDLLEHEEPYLVKEKEDFGSPHFALHRNWINALGYFAPPWFWHFYVDTYNQKIAMKLNRCIFLTKTLVQAKKILDDTGNLVRKNLNISVREDYVWEKVRDRHLESDVKKLQEFIDNYKKN
jgi:hypothetical protein